MRSYIILNGQISTNIQGLLIQNLPPISKPKIRTQIEEIDGRDGDIVTPLGYSAYTKEFSIGLYGDFDINEIIQYFNSEGTVTFSNEEDKYYNYKIIEQIDFERLIRFRTAKVKMHIQPFKYSTEADLKTFTFDTTNKFNFSNWYNNRSDLSVSGTSFEITESNLTLNGVGTMLLGTFTVSTNPLQADIQTIENFGAEVEGNTQYTLSVTNTANFEMMVLYYDEDYKYLSRVTESITTTGNNSFTFTTPSNCSYICFRISNGTSSSVTLSNIAVQLDPIAEFDIYNAGNIYSKPTITITGIGNIGVYLNEVQLFQIQLGDLESITIDTTQMEAYNGASLLNRAVTGNYDDFKLNIGKNTISFSGTVSKVEIENYSRWI